MQMQGSEGGVGMIALAYAMSCVGSALALSAMARSRAVDGRVRVSWLVLAAVSLGGAGIWVMHSVAMLGFSVQGLQITYNVPLMLLSLVVAVVVTGIGLGIAVAGKGKFGALALGGLITGCGVAGMHYMGMSAMRMPASIGYRPLVVLASVVIAVVAATAALWAALNIRGLRAMLGASLVMGLAVTGMHYTGMAALILTAAPQTSAGGPTAFQLLAPLALGIGLSTLIILFIVGVGDSERDLLQKEQDEANLRKLASREV